MAKLIESNEIIKLLDETIDTAQKVLNGLIKISCEQCVKDIEAQWGETIRFYNQSDLPSSFDNLNDDEAMYRELLRLYVKSLQLYRAKSLDKYNKRQMIYRLERQKNDSTIICSIIGVIGVVVGAGLTLILKQ